MLSFLTVGKSILFDGLSKKPRRVLPAKFGRGVISYGTAEDTISGEKIERD